jgi:lysophospholipid acyltransferase (LPLAT)-like uncharacterized protein
MALKLNFSTQLSDKKKLAQIAKSLGYVQTRGHKGEGSVRALLEAIIAGEVVVVASERQRFRKRELDLAKKGIITLPKSSGELSPFEPIVVEGEPLSETIIRERR